MLIQHSSEHEHMEQYRKGTSEFYRSRYVFVWKTVTSEMHRRPRGRGGRSRGRGDRGAGGGRCPNSHITAANQPPQRQDSFPIHSTPRNASNSPRHDLFASEYATPSILVGFSRSPPHKSHSQMILFWALAGTHHIATPFKVT